MRVLNISKRQFEELKPLELSSDIFNSESQLFFLDKRCKYLFKKLYADLGASFSNKLFTVNELITNADKINIDELVIPNKLVSISHHVVGFSMPYVDNINFKQVLNSSEFSTSEKLKYFREIGELLERMKMVRYYTPLKDFYLNDIHENNFILNKSTGKINAVDLDSCKINGNYPFAAVYLSPFSKINEFAKYKKIAGDYSIGGCFEPDYNTELYCYMVMIFNYLLEKRFSILSMDEFYDYLSYLHELGVSYELIDKFALIFSDNNNINPYEGLEELVSVVGKCSYDSYKLSRRK